MRERDEHDRRFNTPFQTQPCIHRGPQLRRRRTRAGLQFDNPKPPEAPPAVDYLDLFGATEPAIGGNQVRGKRIKWVPLPDGPADPDESVRTTQEVATREFEEAAGIVTVPFSASYPKWVYWWIHRVFEDAIFWLYIIGKLESVSFIGCVCSMEKRGKD